MSLETAVVEPGADAGPVLADVTPVEVLPVAATTVAATTVAATTVAAPPPPTVTLLDADGTMPTGLQKPPSIEITIYAVRNLLTGALADIVPYQGTGLAEALRDYLPEGSTEPGVPVFEDYPIRATFSLPTRTQWERYRQEATFYDRQAQDYMVLRSHLRRRIWLHHLEAFAFGAGAKQVVIPLEWEQDKREQRKLTQATVERLDDYHPHLFDVLLTQYRILSLLDV